MVPRCPGTVNGEPPGHREGAVSLPTAARGHPPTGAPDDGTPAMVPSGQRAPQSTRLVFTPPAGPAGCASIGAGVRARTYYQTPHGRPRGRPRHHLGRPSTAGAALPPGRRPGPGGACPDARGGQRGLGHAQGSPTSASATTRSWRSAANDRQTDKYVKRFRARAEPSDHRPLTVG